MTHKHTPTYTVTTPAHTYIHVSGFCDTTRNYRLEARQRTHGSGIYLCVRLACHHRSRPPDVCLWITRPQKQQRREAHRNWRPNGRRTTTHVGTARPANAVSICHVNANNTPSSHAHTTHPTYSVQNIKARSKFAYTTTSSFHPLLCRFPYSVSVAFRVKLRGHHHHHPSIAKTAIHTKNESTIEINQHRT